MPSHYGYYLFLGLGDFGRPTFTPDWTSTWDLAEWGRRLDRLAALGTNTLFVYLLGHELPFASREYPECRETDHPCVKHDFLQDLIAAATARKLRVVAVFTTTGHCQRFTARHPDLAIRRRDGTPMVDSGIVCHHHAAARDYPRRLIAEVLSRCHGFWGVILHPPEFGTPCFCPACAAAYRAATGQDLAQADDQAVSGFFMETNLRFQRDELQAEIRRHLPQGQLLTFTIPWIFAQHFEQIAPSIPRDTVIVDWDYALAPENVAALPARLRRHQAFGHSVWFMPTSGYAFDAAHRAANEAAVLRQIELAHGAGVSDVIYFMGPYWWPTVESTSWHRARAGK